METRSQRRQAQNLRPPYPQAAAAAQSAPTSPTSSVWQSSSSLASITSLNPSGAAGASHNTHMLYAQQSGLASAPLPSPSTNQPPSYFGSLAAGQVSQSQSQAATSQQPWQQQQQQFQHQHRIPQPGHQTFAGSYLGQKGDGGGTPETAPFLNNFSLLQEAAKRAEIACLTRDLGDVGL